MGNDSALLPNSSWKKRERGTYFCLPVDLRRSVLQPLETPSAPLAIPPFLRLPIPPFIAACPVAMRIYRYCYKAVPQSNALQRSWMTTQSGQIARRWLASLAVFKKAPMLNYFLVGPYYIFLIFWNRLQSLFGLTLRLSLCNMSVE